MATVCGLQKDNSPTCGVLPYKQVLCLVPMILTFGGLWKYSSNGIYSHCFPHDKGGLWQQSEERECQDIEPQSRDQHDAENT